MKTQWIDGIKFESICQYEFRAHWPNIALDEDKPVDVLDQVQFVLDMHSILKALEEVCR